MRKNRGKAAATKNSSDTRSPTLEAFVPTKEIKPADLHALKRKSLVQLNNDFDAMSPNWLELPLYNKLGNKKHLFVSNLALGSQAQQVGLPNAITSGLSPIRPLAHPQAMESSLPWLTETDPRFLTSQFLELSQGLSTARNVLCLSRNISTQHGQQSNALHRLYDNFAHARFAEVLAHIQQQKAALQHQQQQQSQQHQQAQTFVIHVHHHN